MTTIAAIAFALTEIAQIFDGNPLAFVNLLGDAASALSGVVALLKDGAILFGWGGTTFQEVLSLLTAIAKAFSAGVNIARAMLGGLWWLATVLNPGEAIKAIGEQVAKDLMPQIIKAIVGGPLFGGADAFSGGVAGLQGLLLTLPDKPTKELPELCQLLGAQC